MAGHNRSLPETFLHRLPRAVAVRYWARRLRVPGVYRPYPLEHYRRLLQTLSDADRYEVMRLCDLGAGRRPDRINVVLRHDVDTRAGAKNLPRFLAMEERFGFRSSSYFRTDGREYEATFPETVLREYREAEFEFALHSLCYLTDEPFEALAAELRRFESVFRTPARTFTLHGMGPRHKAARDAFREACRQRSGGELPATDSLPERIPYALKITDAARRKGERYIPARFAKPPRSRFFDGDAILILTHPGHWETGE